jgi:hypothetical protein
MKVTYNVEILVTEKSKYGKLRVIFQVLLLFVASYVYAQNPSESSEFGLDHQKLINELLERLDHPDQAERIKAGITLISNVNAHDISRLTEALKGGNRVDKQEFIIEALGKLGDWRAADALRFEIELANGESVDAAITALGKLKYDWAVPILSAQAIKAVDERNYARAKRAVSALGVIGSPRAIDALRTIKNKVPRAVANALDWAKAIASGEIIQTASDDVLPAGQRLTKLFEGVRYYFYHPTRARSKARKPQLLTCVHEEDLEVERMFNACLEIAKEHQMAVLVPYFNNIRFPEYSRFNIRGERADLFFLRLVDFVTKTADVESREFYLFGSESGGGFIQRFVMAYPERIARAAVYNPDFALLDEKRMFPDGIGATPFALDIKIDPYKFVKSDLAMFVSTDVDKRLLFPRHKELQEEVEKFEEANGVRSRLAFGVGGRKRDRQISLTDSVEYLFKEN